MCVLSFMKKSQIGTRYRSHPECAKIGSLLELGHGRKGQLLVVVPHATGVGPGPFSSFWEDPSVGADWEKQSGRVWLPPGGSACWPACVALSELLQGL